MVTFECLIAFEMKEMIENKVEEIKNQRVDSAVDNFDKLKKIKELYDLDILSFNPSRP